LRKGNKMGRILDMLQERKPGYHPLVSILELTDECMVDDHRLKLDCHKAIAKYVEAERKSVDIKSEDGSELIKLIINVDDE